MKRSKPMKQKAKSQELLTQGLEKLSTDTRARRKKGDITVDATNILKQQEGL